MLLAFGEKKTDIYYHHDCLTDRSFRWLMILNRDIDISRYNKEEEVTVGNEDFASSSLTFFSSSHFSTHKSQIHSLSNTNDNKNVKKSIIKPYPKPPKHHYKTPFPLVHPKPQLPQANTKKTVFLLLRFRFLLQWCCCESVSKSSNYCWICVRSRCCFCCGGLVCFGGRGVGGCVEGRRIESLKCAYAGMVGGCWRLSAKRKGVRCRELRVCCSGLRDRLWCRCWRKFDGVGVRSRD